jgi:hypothetical protein
MFVVAAAGAGPDALGLSRLPRSSCPPLLGAVSSASTSPRSQLRGGCTRPDFSTVNQGAVALFDRRRRGLPLRRRCDRQPARPPGLPGGAGEGRRHGLSDVFGLPRRRRAAAAAPALGWPGRGRISASVAVSVRARGLSRSNPLSSTREDSGVAAHRRAPYLFRIGWTAERFGGRPPPGRLAGPVGLLRVAPPTGPCEGGRGVTLSERPAGAVWPPHWERNNLQIW